MLKSSTDSVVDSITVLLPKTVRLPLINASPFTSRVASGSASVSKLIPKLLF